MKSKLDTLRDLSWGHSCPACEEPTGGDFCDVGCMRVYWRENVRRRRAVVVGQRAAASGQPLYGYQVPSAKDLSSESECLLIPFSTGPLTS